MMYLVVRNSGQSGELRLWGQFAARESEELKLYLQRVMRRVADFTVDCTAGRAHYAPSGTGCAPFTAWPGPTASSIRAA
ncbi:MAG: hypothetical protein OEW15_04070 [Nitrospirota bacterium]|nr:hypothetical protein [Nitrospirota bacterium]